MFLRKISHKYPGVVRRRCFLSGAVLLLAFSFGAPGTSVAEAWTDTKGRKIEADFVRIDGSDVILRMGGREHKVPLNQLALESGSQAKALDLKPRVTPFEITELKKFRARRDEFRRKREELKRAIPGEGRLIDVFFLQSFMTLERDLALLATPADRVEGETKLPDSLTRSTRPVMLYEIRRLRQRIRDGERELARYRLEKSWSHEPLKFVGPTKLIRQLYDLEAELDGHYSRAVAVLRKEIEGGLKELKKEKATFKREATIARLTGEIAAAEEAREVIQKSIYDFPEGGALGAMAPIGIEEVEELRKELREERDSILKELRGAGGAGRAGGDIESGVVGGYEVFSSKLGVILDVSGSMSNHIARLKKEIAANFSKPHYSDVIGCALIPGLTTRHRTMLAIEELIVVDEADAVYWFCDLRDGRALASVRRLRYLLRSSGASFYLKSVGKQPSEILKALMSER